MCKDFLSGPNTSAKKIYVAHGRMPEVKAFFQIYTDCLCRLRQHDGKCKEIELVYVLRRTKGCKE